VIEQQYRVERTVNEIGRLLYAEFVEDTSLVASGRFAYTRPLVKWTVNIAHWRLTFANRKGRLCY